MEVNKVGIIGAGTMGEGIAQAAALAGFQVSVLDISDTLVRKAFDKIERRLAKWVEKGKLDSGDKEIILDRIHMETRIEALSDSQLIVEAVAEDLALKIDLFRDLGDLCSPETVFASNTSSLSITQMAGATSSPNRLLGLHFFNPAHIMRLVEVVPALQTSDKVLEVGFDFVRRIKKTPVRVRECPGFLVNRIIMPYSGEAMLSAQEGAAHPEEIDEAVKKMGFPMGPLALNDMVGIDVGVNTFDIMHEAYGERFPIPLLFNKLFKAGRLGTKSGKGVFADGKVDDEFLEIVRNIQNETEIKDTEFSAERLVLRQVNEAVYCLQEMVASAEDIDRAMVLGTGFPLDETGKGGPLHWADNKGLDWVLDQLEHFKYTLGARFRPPFLLKRYVSAGYFGKKAKKGFFEY